MSAGRQGMVRLRRGGQRPPGGPRPGPGAGAGPAPGVSDVAQLVAALRRLRTRPERERTGTCYVEGVGLVTQALAAGAEIERCVIAPELLSGDAGRSILDTLRRRGVPIVELPAGAFASISFKENQQGIGAVVRTATGLLEDVRLEPGTLGWVALSEVGNAGNLGAVFRTCDAVGCRGVILLGDTTDPYHPDALRASRGTIFSLRLARASFDQFAAWARARGCRVVGTTPDAPGEYRDASYQTPLVLLMGSERLGLSAEQQKACDVLVRIPMVGRSDSLNLAVATSVLLYEVFDQHRRPRPAPAAAPPA